MKVHIDTILDYILILRCEKIGGLGEKRERYGGCGGPAQTLSRIRVLIPPASASVNRHSRDWPMQEYEGPPPRL